MPGMKPSEKFSVVPEGLRKRFRERMNQEPKMDNEMPEGPRYSEEDREALKNMIEEGPAPRKYAKGGMVKVRGYGKARSKPCKIC